MHDNSESLIGSQEAYWGIWAEMLSVYEQSIEQWKGIKRVGNAWNFCDDKCVWAKFYTLHVVSDSKHGFFKIKLHKEMKKKLKVMKLLIQELQVRINTFDKSWCSQRSL